MLFAEPDTNKIEIGFPNGKTISCPVGIRADTVLPDLDCPQKDLAAILINNEMASLSTPLYTNSCIKPVFLESPQGALILRRTLSFLLYAASKKVFPERVLRIGHSLGDCYYFSYCGGEKITENDIELLNKAIDDFIKKDLDIEYTSLPYNDAAQLFEKEKQQDTLLLLQQNADAKIFVNMCDGFIDIYTAPLLAKTALIKTYHLFLYKDGMLLHFPHKQNEKLTEFTDQPKIFAVFNEYKKRGKTLGVSSVAHLNQLVLKQEIKEFIDKSEAFADKKIAEIADTILKRCDEIQLILIAGPSGSGKTTTAKRLSIQLKMRGIESIPMSLDDYYLPPDKVPRDENGDSDLECPEALDIPYLNEQLCSFFAGKEITLPLFDFKKSQRTKGKNIRLGRQKTVLLIEGIHGLNDQLTPHIKMSNKFKIYVSPLIQLNLDEHHRISTNDNRLLRRIARDYQFRGVSAEKTLEMWPSVHRGSEKYIFKFQNDADMVFNSALDYEISVLKLYAEPLLRSVRPELEIYSEAARLLLFLQNFYPIQAQYVPSLSVLREFIGESEFTY